MRGMEVTGGGEEGKENGCKGACFQSTGLMNSNGSTLVPSVVWSMTPQLARVSTLSTTLRSDI